MWPFTRPAKTPPKSWWLRIAAVEDQLEAFNARIDERYTELKRLRGLVNQMRSQDDPGDTNAEQQEVEQPPVPQRSVPFHLRRRIRGF